MATSLSNYLFFLKDILSSATVAGGTFRVSPDLELSTVLESAGGQVKIKLQNGTQIERMIITATGGMFTIVKRGLKQDFATEDATLNKTWNDGTIGEITFSPQDLLGYGIVDNDFVFNGNVVFNKSVGDPIYATPTARNTAIPSPRNGMSCYITSLGVAQDYINGAWTNRGTSTPLPTTIVGEMRIWSTNTAPSGWFVCDGSAISRTTYSDLFAVIGTIYGVGDGSTTFNVPNLKGRAIVGRDASQTEFDVLGETGGEKTHVLTESEMPSHNHNLISEYSGGGGGTVIAKQTGVSPTASSSAWIENTGGGLAHNNLQPYLVMNYIIKY